MKTILHVTAVIALAADALLPLNAGAETHENGVTYSVLQNPQATATGPSKVEVIEFFWYGCPHCFAFEPYLEDWIQHKKPANAEFTRIPVAEGFAWAKPMARAFYTEVALGIVDKLHKAIFDEIHRNHHILKTEADFKAFFEKHGVSAKQFDATWNSFAVTLNVNRAAHEQEAYQIAGVPTIAVGGRYTATLGAGQGPEQLPHAMDFLIRKAAKQK